jgi:hypothetical protein
VNDEPVEPEDEQSYRERIGADEEDSLDCPEER